MKKKALFFIQFSMGGILLLFLQSCHNNENTLPEIKLFSDTTGIVVSSEKGLFYPSYSIQRVKKYNINQDIEYYYKSEKVYEQDDSVVGFDMVDRGWEIDSTLIDSVLYYSYNGFYSEMRNLEFKNGKSFYSYFSISLQSQEKFTYKNSKEIIAYLINSLDSMKNENQLLESSQQTPFGEWFYKFKCDAGENSTSWLGFDCEWNTIHSYNYTFHKENILMIEKRNAPVFVKVAFTLLSNKDEKRNSKYSYLEKMDW